MSGLWLTALDIFYFSVQHLKMENWSLSQIFTVLNEYSKSHSTYVTGQLTDFIH